jgi:hypothetical protein
MSSVSGNNNFWTAGVLSSGSAARVPIGSRIKTMNVQPLYSRFPASPRSVSDWFSNLGYIEKYSCADKGEYG